MATREQRGNKEKKKPKADKPKDKTPAYLRGSSSSSSTSQVSQIQPGKKN